MSPRTRSLLAWMILSPALWLIGIALIAHAGMVGRFDPRCQSRVTICPGSIRGSEIWLTGNLLILSVVMQPWSIKPLAPRLGRTALTAFGLSMLVTALGMHGGADITAHLRWLTAVAAVLGLAWYVAHRAERLAQRGAP